MIPALSNARRAGALRNERKPSRGARVTLMLIPCAAVTGIANQILAHALVVGMYSMRSIA
jgi:hypothetical protein